MTIDTDRASTEWDFAGLSPRAQRVDRSGFAGQASFPEQAGATSQSHVNGGGVPEEKLLCQTYMCCPFVMERKYASNASTIPLMVDSIGMTPTTSPASTSVCAVTGPIQARQTCARSSGSAPSARKRRTQFSTVEALVKVIASTCRVFSSVLRWTPPSPGTVR